MMSLKAYDFYIMKKNKLNDYLLHAKKVMTILLITRFRGHNELEPILTCNKFDMWEKFKGIQEGINKAMQGMTFNSQISHLDLTCGISVWLWNDYAVVKVYGLNYQLASKMKQPRYVQDFHYQNSTDKPEEIDGREWGRRKKFFWNTIDKLPRMDYIPYDFLSSNAFHTIHELRSEYDKLKKKYSQNK